MTITVYSSSSSLRITLAASVSLILIITTCVPFSRAARSSFKTEGSSPNAIGSTTPGSRTAGAVSCGNFSARQGNHYPE